MRVVKEREWVLALGLQTLRGLNRESVWLGAPTAEPPLSGRGFSCSLLAVASLLQGGNVQGSHDFPGWWPVVAFSWTVIWYFCYFSLHGWGGLTFKHFTSINDLHSSTFDQTFLLSWPQQHHVVEQILGLLKINKESDRSLALRIPSSLIPQDSSSTPDGYELFMSRFRFIFLNLFFPLFFVLFRKCPTAFTIYPRNCSILGMSGEALRA